MAERRMFAKTIIDSDAFLDMPITSQLLYFHLSMRADDDGFVNQPKSIMRSLGAKEDDIKVLIAKKFVIAFEEGVVVIKHWRIHNYIQNDRYKETKYLDLKSQLSLDENKSYSVKKDPCIQNVSTMDTQVRLGKDSIGKDSIDIHSVDIKDSEYITCLPLKDGTEYSVTQGDLTEWENAYPFIDVKQELQKMRAWCIANTSKRKTRSHIKRFVVNWLSKTETDNRNKPSAPKNNFSGLNDLYKV